MYFILVKYTRLYMCTCGRLMQKFCTASYLEKVATTSHIYNVKVAFKVEEMAERIQHPKLQKSWRYAKVDCEVAHQSAATRYTSAH